jgi:hypothetical protein
VERVEPVSLALGAVRLRMAAKENDESGDGVYLMRGERTGHWAGRLLPVAIWTVTRRSLLAGPQGRTWQPMALGHSEEVMQALPGPQQPAIENTYQLRTHIHQWQLPWTECDAMRSRGSSMRHGRGTACAVGKTPSGPKPNSAYAQPEGAMQRFPNSPVTQSSLTVRPLLRRRP